jgi:hypothetical protein
MHYRRFARTLRAALMGLATAALVVSFAPTASAATSPNLMKNSTAEAAAGGTGGTVPVPGWTRTTGTSFTAVKYNTPNFPSTMNPCPPNPGKNFFAGGNDHNFSDIVAVQTVSLSAYVSKIQTGTVTFTAAGWFGGQGSQRDMALMEIDFKDVNGFLIGTSTTVGGVTAANRNNHTGLLHRLKTGSVPAAARSAYVQAIFERLDGSYNNGYADNITLTLSGV